MPPDLYSVLSGAAAAANGGSGSSSSPDNSLQDASGKLQQVLQEQWQALFERAGHLDRCTEVPSHLLCPLTMEVRSDCVVHLQLESAVWSSWLAPAMLRAPDLHQLLAATGCQS